MFKTTFSKFFSTFVVMIIITLTITGVLISSLISFYATTKNEETLTGICDQVTDLTASYIEHSKPIDLYYQLMIDGISSRNNCFILIVNQNGETVCSTSNSFSGKIESAYTDGVLDGERKIFKAHTLDIFTEKMFTVATPIISNGKTVGAVYSSISLKKMRTLFNYIVRTCLISDVLTIIIALLISYFVSKRMIKPIKSLNEAAKKISKGEFDITVNNDSASVEIAELTNTFNEMSQSLNRLENMRSSFIANVSHELRTPLTTISGFVEGMLDGTIPYERQDTYLKIVSDEAKRLTSLVNGILALAKSENSSRDFDFKKFNLSELLRTSIIKFEKRIKEKNISLYIMFENEVYVNADKDAILQVITNLIDNAIKFTDTNGKIELNITDYKDNQVLVSISNTGHGISESEQILIWDRFYKTDKSRNNDKTGTGLGLFIVKDIINKHSQKIWVDSKIDEKTVFSFTLNKA